MRTPSQLTESFELLSWMTVFLLVGWLAYRGFSIFFKKRKRFWFWQVKGQILPKILKVLTFLTMLAMVLSIPPVLLVLSPSGRFVPPLTTWALLVAGSVVGLAELGLSLSISERLMKYGWKKIIGGIMLLILGIIFFPLFFSIPEFMADPPKEEAFALSLPIEGTWAAAHAGTSSKVNYHSAYRSQKYAIDMVKVDEEERFFVGKGMKMEDFFTYKARIFAPIGGIIVQAENHLPDKPVSFAPNDTLNPAGNHVVIQFAPDRYLFLAHLYAGSLAVAQGDTVQAGDFIGLAGNSGNTSWPHLHIHIQDKPTIDPTATAYPFYFQHLLHKRWMGWNQEESKFLLRNDLFRPAEQ